MKNLDLKRTIQTEVTVTADGKPEELNVAAIIMPSIVVMPKDGEFDSMITRVTLVQKIRKAISEKKKSILLETAEHEELVKALKISATKMNVIEPAIFTYITELAVQKDVDVDVAEDKKKKHTN